jgi:hypothetical protein
VSRELQHAVGPKREKVQADLADLLAESRTAVAERRSKLPQLEFQPDLPVNERRADIAGLIAKNQVVIVCGETGSGKTTPLPKICLDLGLGARRLIGLTEYFAFYAAKKVPLGDNGQRPHQSLRQQTPDVVYRSAVGGGAIIVDKFGGAVEAAAVQLNYLKCPNR